MLLKFHHFGRLNIVIRLNWTEKIFSGSKFYFYSCFSLVQMLKFQSRVIYAKMFMLPLLTMLVHSIFLLFFFTRRVSKDSHGMECDCTMSKEDLIKGRKGCGNDCLNRLLFIECSKTCSLGKRCSNRRFQNVENAPTEVFKTDYKGFGVRATADIHP